ncbi:MAG: type 1 glutamine amidotransferase [Chitinophagaceae bacterium]
MSYSAQQIRVAILDLYEGHENQGMRCLREIINQWGESNELDIECDEFDVRRENAVPDLTYDIFISSGGPGSPIDSVDTEWEKQYFTWLKSVEQYNADVMNSNKKRVFFICHSFQLACRYYNIGNVCKRVSTSFGVFPIHTIGNAENELVFEGLNNPFYVVDSRDWQVIEPNYDVIKSMGAEILAIEKNRPHVPYERAIMAVRFNEYFIGTQFHPEADAVGMRMYLLREDKKENVIKNHSEAKWQSMVDQLQDPEKILYTHSHILPNFLNLAIGEMA